MPQQELLNLLVAFLEQAGFPYFLTGSIASSLQGDPRLSHDIDVVVALDDAAVPTFTSAFPSPEFYISESAMKQAIRSQSMFNLLRVSDGEKVDFWILTNQPFDQMRFSRRQKLNVDGQDIYVSTPEDTILMKLKWAIVCGGSEKQLNDVRGIFDLQSELLDIKYIHHWATELGVEDLLNTLLNSNDRD